jgi:hypothetical protein
VLVKDNPDIPSRRLRSRSLGERVWRRYGKSDEEIELILGALKWTDGSPVDLTMWQDWLAAVQIARNGRTP